MTTTSSSKYISLAEWDTATTAERDQMLKDGKMIRDEDAPAFIARFKPGRRTSK